MASGFLQKGAALREEVLKTPKALERWAKTQELDLRLNNEQGLGEMNVSLLCISACYHVSTLDSHRLQPSVL